MPNIARDWCELQATLQQRPLFRMQHFASMLGWRGLRMGRVWVDPGKPTDNWPPGEVIVWYETRDIRFHIQINEHPIGQWNTHSAAVIAERYKMVPTAIHEFTLFADDVLLRVEAERLLPFLGRRNFRDKEWRKRLKRDNPERFYPECWPLWKWK